MIIMLWLFATRRIIKILDLGNIMVSDGGKAELTKEYLIDDIGGIGLSYDKISGVAVAKDEG